jgi:hypothetical protein
VPRIEGNPIQLHINGETIDSKHEQAIRFAASSSAIIKQIKRRNEWNDETFHSDAARESTLSSCVTTCCLPARW